VVDFLRRAFVHSFLSSPTEIGDPRCRRSDPWIPAFAGMTGQDAWEFLVYAIMAP
jgi:hypothetical protein